jgi:hypothetical protein
LAKNRAGNEFGFLCRTKTKKLLEMIDMLFVLWFKFDPSHAHRVLELWKQFKYPGKVKVINRVLLIGIHESLAIFDAPDAESLLKITAPFHELGVAHIHPAMPIEEAIKVKL